MNNFDLGAFFPSCLVSELQELHALTGTRNEDTFPEIWPSKISVISRNMYAKFSVNRFTHSRAISKQTLHTNSQFQFWFIIIIINEN
jgi:hypothetical protein